jgi:hypothetical protein
MKWSQFWVRGNYGLAGMSLQMLSAFPSTISSLKTGFGG